MRGKGDQLKTFLFEILYKAMKMTKTQNVRLHWPALTVADNNAHWPWWSHLWRHFQSAAKRIYLY